MRQKLAVIGWYGSSLNEIGTFCHACFNGTRNHMTKIQKKEEIWSINNDKTFPKTVTITVAA